MLFFFFVFIFRFSRYLRRFSTLTLSFFTLTILLVYSLGYYQAQVWSLVVTVGYDTPDT